MGSLILALPQNLDEWAVLPTTPRDRPADYTIIVSNAGVLPISGTTVVTELAPIGLSLVSLSGLGWTCSATTCTRSEGLVPRRVDRGYARDVPVLAGKKRICTFGFAWG